MVEMNGYTVTPHHRQNRRRERPGSRTRRTITRKSNAQYDCYEGLLDARDTKVNLPSDRSKPSPLLRQNIDLAWQRWKTRQAEEKHLAEMDRMQMEQEQLKLTELFGGDVDDDVSVTNTLCEPMLSVVIHLFGDIDYTDP